jgi:hypothetical protein
MLTCYSLINSFNLRLLIILVGALVIKCDGKNNLREAKPYMFYIGLDHLITNADDYSCPFIETLSFGSDIDIKCNNTHLILNEINVSTE